MVHVVDCLGEGAAHGSSLPCGSFRWVRCRVRGGGAVARPGDQRDGGPASATAAPAERPIRPLGYVSSQAAQTVSEPVEMGHFGKSVASRKTVVAGVAVALALPFAQSAGAEI